MRSKCSQIQLEFKEMQILPPYLGVISLSSGKESRIPRESPCPE